MTLEVGDLIVTKYTLWTQVADAERWKLAAVANTTGIILACDKSLVFKILINGAVESVSYANIKLQQSASTALG